MDTDGHRRYLIVGSVILEVVTPLFRNRLVEKYLNNGYQTFKEFLNSQLTMHILCHLRPNDKLCCKDNQRCIICKLQPQNNTRLHPFYTDNGPRYHWRYGGKDIKIDDLDVTLASILLLDCCNLGQDTPFVENLGQCMENYFTHHATKAISQTEYSSYWSTLVANVLQLDDTKKDEIERIEQRQVDEEQMNRLNNNLDEVYFVRDLLRLNL